MKFPGKLWRRLWAILSPQDTPLEGRSVVEQVMLLTGIAFEDEDAVAEASPDDIAQTLYQGSVRLFRERIEAGVPLTVEEWNEWGKSKGGLVLRDWWQAANERVEELRQARLARFIIDDANSGGVVEAVIIGELDIAAQDFLVLQRFKRYMRESEVEQWQSHLLHSG